MSKRVPTTVLMILGLCAAAKPAAACITPTNTNEYHKTKSIFDVGGSTFGVSLDVQGGLWSARDLRAPLEWIPGAAAMIPSDYARVTGRADADINFFGEEFKLLDLSASATRSDGSYSKKFTIDVAGIDLYSGSNTLTSTMKDIGPFSAPFYTAVASYGVATARGTISGEIGMRARGAAASSGLDVEGRSWAALVLRGSAGVSIGVAGVGLSGEVDLLEVGLDFKDKTGLSSGTYTFQNSYNARTLDGSLAVKASALGASTTLWNNSWNGRTIATTQLYNASGCVN
jgi:hypothetical protein